MAIVLEVVFSTFTSGISNTLSALIKKYVYKLFYLKQLYQVGKKQHGGVAYFRTGET